MENNILEDVKSIFAKLDNFELEQKVDLINKIKLELKNYSPFKSEPTDCVIWIKNNNVFANDYNPNSVAPPRNAIIARKHFARRIHSTYCILVSR